MTRSGIMPISYKKLELVQLIFDDFDLICVYHFIFKDFPIYCAFFLWWQPNNIFRYVCCMYNYGN